MNRREVMLSGMVVTGAALASGVLTSTAFAATPAALQKVVDTSAHCAAVGMRCVRHCSDELAKGNKVMAECLDTVNDMIAACEGLQRLAANQSKHTAAFAKVCMSILADCAKACEKHKDHMAICKECAEACHACEEACKAIL